jgi:hypothetical protein
VLPNADRDEESGDGRSGTRIKASSKELALKQLRTRPPPVETPPEKVPKEVSSPQVDSNFKDLHALQQSQSPTLSVHQFKALWGSLPVHGSFQCKLRSAPNMQVLTQHLRKQNFHVVFAASPSDTETEVSICNIRPSGDDAWFMARFLFSKSVFSAAMKAQNAGDVEGYVRKFALARVLKIDTNTVS